MKSFYAQEGQSIHDIAFMAYGDNNAIVKLMQENPTINMAQSTYAGVKINYTPVANTSVAQNKLNGRVIATKTQKIKTDYLLQENGFGFTLEDGTGKIELE